MKKKELPVESDIADDRAKMLGIDVCVASARALLRVLFLRRAIGMGSRRMRS